MAIVADVLNHKQCSVMFKEKHLSYFCGKKAEESGDEHIHIHNRAPSSLKKKKQTKIYGSL